MTQIPEQSVELSMRTPQEVMRLERLGCHYPTRLSFMRVLTRRMLRHKWRIERSAFNLDEHSAGEIIYTVHTPNDLFTFAVFSHPVDRNRGSDQLTADQWDITATLCAGEVDDEHLAMLRTNVPRQEAGRLDSRSLVLTRAHSTRSFKYVVDQLAQGKQPQATALSKAGYLHRTTAIYGSGKFGMCDWMQVKKIYPDFARPFAAEMFSCFMLRQASFDIAEHTALTQTSSDAVKLKRDTKRYLGIGNTTGLGMAPFLICHPLLINQWIACRETALARIKSQGKVNGIYRTKLAELLARAKQHIGEINISSESQNLINSQSASALDELIPIVKNGDYTSWEELVKSATRLSPDTQEILFSCVLEMYPELVDELADSAEVDEIFHVQPEQPLKTLKTMLEHHYDWALKIDFDNPDGRAIFWYRPAEKMEPRLGRTNIDDGADRQLHVDVARQAYDLHEHICDHVERNPDDLVAHFLINYPALRYIVSRVQTMATSRYGEIRANLLDIDITPTELMRCKLAFFGASHFDPYSRVWVNSTLFQGAPVLDDLGLSGGADVVDLNESTISRTRLDDWSFPVLPTSKNATVE